MCLVLVWLFWVVPPPQAASTPVKMNRRVNSAGATFIFTRKERELGDTGNLLKLIELRRPASSRIHTKYLIAWITRTRKKCYGNALSRSTPFRHMHAHSLICQPGVSDV